VIVVLTAVPVTVEVVGFVAPPPDGDVNTCVVAVKTILAAGVPGAPVAPALPVSRAGLVVEVVASPRVTVVRYQINVPGVLVGVDVDHPVVGATVSEELTEYSFT
jgi:hypothetical protein